MRLSEAIRLGSMLGPQLFYQLSDLANVDSNATCAQGAALLAVGALATLSAPDRGEYVFAEFTQRWPEMMFVTDQHCPACARHAIGPFAGMLSHLNNEHEWSRERIADYVEQIENQITAEQHVNKTEGVTKP